MFFKDSEQHNDGTSQYFLGDCYMNGLGVPVNYEESVKWYEKAANNNNSESVYICGLLFYDGTYKDLAVTQDFNKAFKYLMRAFEYSNTPENLKGGLAKRISACYRFGRGVEINEEKADYYLEQAGKYGDTDAEELNNWLQSNRGELTI